MIDKKSLSERDICTKFITPAIVKAGWDSTTQFLEEVSFTDGKIYVRGKLHSRGKAKRADYILYYKPNIPIAIIEAKDNKHGISDGLQQALDYSQILDIPFVFSSNGDGFIFHDKTATDGNLETEIDNDNFPSPEMLWNKYKKYKGIETAEEEKIIEQDYYDDGTKRKPHRVNVGSIALLNEERKGLISPAYVIFKTKPETIINELLLKFLKSSEGLRQIKFHARGTVRQALRFEDLCKIEISIPDFETQKELVEKLNIQQKEGNKITTELSHQLELVRQLRQAFLREAMQGKLVSQDTADDPPLVCSKRSKLKEALEPK